MAGIKLLVDTDIFIDYLKGIKTAKALFDSGTVEIYYSILTEKELLSKPGLRDSERRRILSVDRRGVGKLSPTGQKQDPLCIGTTCVSAPAAPPCSATNKRTVGKGLLDSC